MKSILRITLLLSLSLMLFVACNDDDKPSGAPPTGDNISDVIIAAQGETIVIKGTFESESGFAKISLTNDELLLDKQIVFANHVTKYFLDYSFAIPEGASSKDYEVMIKAESLSGKTEDFTTTLDIASPPESGNIVLSFNGNPGDEIVFTGTITDIQGLSLIVLLNEGIGLDHTIDLPDHPTSYELNYAYTIPGDAEKALHNGTIVIENISDRSTSFAIGVNLTGEDVVYETMYAAGGFQWYGWDAGLAYQMYPDPDDDRWFEVPLHCWDDYDEVKFLGQLDWNPNNWGLVDQSDPSKGMVNDESSAAILMGANGGNPAYKMVRFNPYDMQYTVEDITDAKTPRTEMYIVGGGFPGYPDLNWNPEEAIPMQANPDGYGEHIFVIYGLEFSDDVSMKFIGQNTGWDYDAGFDVDVQEVTAPVSWVKIKEGSGTKDLKFKDQAGTYTVLFDYYIGRALIWKE
ncbi:hypothetical protein E9993_11450 [Labilibacter sediminis]|nr:hypothetical protein E9993_11450 [Labilibacter sediminis]